MASPTLKPKLEQLEPHEGIDETVTLQDVIDIVTKNSKNPANLANCTDMERHVLRHVIKFTVPCPNFNIDYSGLVHYLFALTFDDVNSALHRYVISSVIQEYAILGKYSRKNPCRWVLLLRNRDEALGYDRPIPRQARRETETSLSNLVRIDFSRIFVDGQYYWQATYRMASSYCNCRINFPNNKTPRVKHYQALRGLSEEEIQLAGDLRLRSYAESSSKIDVNDMSISKSCQPS